jgi:hypothetical protein
VHDFHRAALRIGGADYYAAFLVDPDGYRIEATINQAVPADAHP